MADGNSLIDFKKLVSPVAGEGLEGLTRLLGRRLGLTPVWSGRGADGGRDLLFTETLVGPLVLEKVTWVVSCKDKAESGTSVTEHDFRPGVLEKVIQHRANGYLLVTTTTAGTAAKALLDSLDVSNGGTIRTLVWDNVELTSMLLDPLNEDLLKQYLPESYERVKGLTSLEGALLKFRDRLPDEVLAEVMRIVKPYSDFPLRGVDVWPHDSATSNAIDRITHQLIVEQSIEGAVAESEGLTAESFVSLVEAVYRYSATVCYDFLSNIISTHDRSEIRLNAAQALFEKYELSASDRLLIASNLDPDSLSVLFSDETGNFIQSQLHLNTPDYDLYQSIDELSSHTSLSYVGISHIEFEAVEDERIEFRGELWVDIDLEFAGESVGSRSIQGEFTGYFDAEGIYLESATVDPYANYGSDEEEPEDLIPYDGSSMEF